MKKKKSLFNYNWCKDGQWPSLINQDELAKLKDDVGELLEIKICKICNEKKIIYYFTVNEKKDEYDNICIECSKTRINQIVCKKCGEKKNTNEYFTVRDKGYTDICKVCINELFKDNKTKNITKVCNKCKQELPATNKFFKAAGHYKDFLENKCRKCKNLNYLSEK